MKKTELMFKEEASKWLEAFPIGNGRFGGMVYGGVCTEQIALNEESFWSGYPHDNDRPEIQQYLGEVRNYVRQGNYAKAQEIIEHHMLSRFTCAYQPLGTLWLDFSRQDEVLEYERSLHMETGMVTVRYKTGRADYEREYFCSYPDKVMAVKLVVKGEDKLDFTVRTDSPVKYETQVLESGELHLESIAPSDVVIEDVYNFLQDSRVEYEEKGNIHGDMLLAVVHTGGSVERQEKSLKITGADECILYLTATTSFKEKNGIQWCRKCLEAAVGQGYESLKTRHVRDLSSLLGRVSLSLNNGEKEADLLTEQLFQFGRYLMTASSREGSLPSNLQGIWNDKCIPPWWSNWTMNINLEMNYWPAYRCNLAECAEPLNSFIGRMAEKGEKTARLHYGCNGWTAHHMMDIWMNTAPVGYNNKPEKDSASWAMWPYSGSWLCLHLWENYRYTGNLEFLRDYAYPVMRGNAEFVMDWLVEEKGVFETMPSTSPENIYLTEDGKRVSVCKSSAMDMEIISELLDYVEQAGVLIGESADFLNKVRDCRKRLAPLHIGSKGQILEWGEEWQEEEPGHRHFSHLFGLYPGHQFTREKNREFWNAARVSLEGRMNNGGGSTGWSRVWAICLWARLGCGKEAYESVKVFQEEDVFANLFGFCPPEYFEIDCNFGYTAAIAEMLLQTEDGVIVPLPAIPEEWQSGEIKGLVCEGGNVVDIRWEDGKVQCMKIHAAENGVLKVRMDEELIEAKLVKGQTFEIMGNRV